MARPTDHPRHAASGSREVEKGRRFVLQALHEGAAVREQLHQRQGQVPSAAGVRMLRRICGAIAVAALLLEPSSIRADVDDCREAIRALKSARSDIASAFKTYGSCVANSDGHDDCSSEFGSLRSAQDDFESAVSSYEGECS